MPSKKKVSRKKTSKKAKSTIMPEDCSGLGRYVQQAEQKQEIFSSMGLETATDVDEHSAMVESICGVADDSQAVEQYDGTLGVTQAFVAANQSRICQVQWKSDLNSRYRNPGNVNGVRWGTGAMISSNIMITCGHLFDQRPSTWRVPRDNGSGDRIPPEEIAQNMQVNFNFQRDRNGDLRVEQSFDILELVEYRLGNLDMAICRIDGNPGATFGTLNVSTTDANVADMICIIGHPSGSPKRIEAGPTTSLTGNLIRYNDIDTMGGNSGSPIIRASDGQVVGVHTNGGCNSNSPGPGGGSNFGLRITSFISNSPTLQRLTRPKLKFSDDLKVPDDTKLKFRDDIKFKFRDDAKLKFRDDIKLKVRDDVKSKAVDDVKNPALDKFPGTDVGRFPGTTPPRRSFGFDPHGGEAPGQQPFILATPHHSNAWQGQVTPSQNQSDQEVAELEGHLNDLQSAIQEADQQLSEMNAQYQELIAHYQSLVSQS